jgi:hypothetical protein
LSADEQRGVYLDFGLWFPFALPQDLREKRVTLDEAPSGVYLYPEEELGADSIFSSSPGKPSGTVFEEAQKEILKLMKIEVSLISS